MGTKIFAKYGISVKRFYGGQERGVCYQVNVSSEGWVQLTRAQFDDVLKTLMEFRFNEMIEEKQIELEKLKRRKSLLTDDEK